MPLTLQDHRREIYAQAAAVLDEDHSVPGAEALFDQALTNGLLVIAAAIMPDHAAAEDPPPRRLPSASDLLMDLAGDATSQTVTISFTCGSTSGDLVLEVGQLRDAVRRTQVARHGRGPADQVTMADVKALLTLDEHPALHSIGGQYLDKTWRQAQVDDQKEVGRAAEFLSHLGSEEIERRVDEAQKGYDPGDEGPEPQECPVCGNNTLVADASDEFGYGTTAGTCLVCSYRRSEDAALDLNLDQEWQTRWQ